MFDVSGTPCCAKCKTPYGHSAAAGRCCHPITTVDEVESARRSGRPPRSSKVRVWHDEMQRFERTGRLDEGPCWCSGCIAAELAEEAESHDGTAEWEFQDCSQCGGARCRPEPDDRAKETP